MTALAGKTIALAVTGSIAAYKAVEVARLCIKAGAVVLPLMTTSAQRFVGAVTLAGITGEPVATDMWDPAFPGEMHVSIAARADLIVIVPATADVLSRLAHGRADDLLTATVLCARGPVLAAPAMHPRMWTHPATQESVATLARHGRVTLVGPVSGPVASGESGIGRMQEPVEIVAAIARALGGPTSGTRGDLAGRRVVVTAGPTYEAIDPVRFLGNRSSGKMGFAIAARAAARGASVTLVSGPVALGTPAGIARRIDVESAAELAAALDEVLGPDLHGADALVMAAAVADFRAAAASTSKIKKGAGSDAPSLALARNPDVLAGLGARRAGRSPVLVGFALETGDDATVLAYARGKRASKKVDLVVANAAHESLGREDNRVAIVSERGAAPFMTGPKEAVADHVLDALVAELARGEAPPAR
ncbi:MAG: Phosphopantothenoylcysteine decarboxylase [Labilithrix sp.]|nr:Phosphopantothenoylcysteine decarboxylase [Labilithrix sp.]